MIVEVAPNITMENNQEAIDSMKETIVVEIAKHIEKKYGIPWKKCVELAKSASWFKDYIVDELTAIDIDGLVADVFKQIDNNEIL